MKTTHTPGPWAANISELEASSSLVSVRTENGGYLICSDAGYQNAPLIAAAPDLLDILDRILRAHESGNNGSVMGEAVLCQSLAIRAREAINKAKGL